MPETSSKTLFTQPYHSATIPLDRALAGLGRATNLR